MMWLAIALLIIVSLMGILIFYRKPRFSFKLPEGYRNLLEQHVSFYQDLDPPGRINFEKKLGAFLQFVRITGVRTEVTDLDRLLVAAGAVIPVFGFPEWRYYNLSEVLLYSDRFNADSYSSSGNGRNVLGMVGNGALQREMILSKPDLYKGFGSGGGKENTAIHEFVHLLDKDDGAVDGIPSSLLTKELCIPWLKMMSGNIAAIKAGKSDINVYGATNHAEFLAVAAEYFFDKPDQFKRKHAELYEMLCAIFRQKPLKKVEHDRLLNERTGHG